MTVKRKALETAAQELNFFLDPNPPINIKAKSDELKQKVLEAGNLLEEGEQDLSLSTETGLEGDDLEKRKMKIAGIQNTLKELGVKLFGGEEVKKTKQTGGEEVKKTETTLVETVQEAKKLVDLKAIVEAEDEFESLQAKLNEYTGLAGPRTLKAEMLKILGVKVKASEKKKKEKKEREPSVYGTTVALMCQTPGMKKEELLSKLEAQGIDFMSVQSAVGTGYSCVRKIVSLLKEAGHMK